MIGSDVISLTREMLNCSIASAKWMAKTVRYKQVSISTMGHSAWRYGMGARGAEMYYLFAYLYTLMHLLKHPFTLTLTNIDKHVTQ